MVSQKVSVWIKRKEDKTNNPANDHVWSYVGSIANKGIPTVNYNTPVSAQRKIPCGLTIPGHHRGWYTQEHQTHTCTNMAARSVQFHLIIPRRGVLGWNVSSLHAGHAASHMLARCPCNPHSICWGPLLSPCTSATFIFVSHCDRESRECATLLQTTENIKTREN